jgi:hypothetical protein
VYVDVDPIPVAHVKALLAGTDSNAMVAADLRHVPGPLAASPVRRLSPLSQSIAYGGR